MVFGAFVSAAVCSKLRFDNYQVFSVPVLTEEQHDKMKMLENGDYIFWNGVKTGRSTDVMISPDKIENFHQQLFSLGLNSTLKVENVQKYDKKIW